MVQIPCIMYQSSSFRILFLVMPRACIFTIPLIVRPITFSNIQLMVKFNHTNLNINKHFNPQTIPIPPPTSSLNLLLHKSHRLPCRFPPNSFRNNLNRSKPNPNNSFTHIVHFNLLMPSCVNTHLSIQNLLAKQHNPPSPTPKQKQMPKCVAMPKCILQYPTRRILYNTVPTNTLRTKQDRPMGSLLSNLATKNPLVLCLPLNS